MRPAVLTNSFLRSTVRDCTPVQSMPFRSWSWHRPTSRWSLQRLRDQVVPSDLRVSKFATSAPRSWFRSAMGRWQSSQPCRRFGCCATKRHHREAELIKSDGSRRPHASMISPATALRLWAPTGRFRSPSQRRREYGQWTAWKPCAPRRCEQVDMNLPYVSPASWSVTSLRYMQAKTWHAPSPSICTARSRSWPNLNAVAMVPFWLARSCRLSPSTFPVKIHGLPGSNGTKHCPTSSACTWNFLSSP